MIKIIFVCHGNICRSPTAEFLMKDMVAKAGLGDEFYIRSAATSTDDIGSPVYTEAEKRLNARSITCKGKTARQITLADMESFDLVIGMDDANIEDMRRMFGPKLSVKLHRLLDYTANPRELDDPWYTHDFDRAFAEISEGCTGLLEHLREEHGI